MKTGWKLAAAATGGVVATLAAGGIALAATYNGLGRFGATDVNRDGSVTRAEWVTAANARFARLDANADGKLVAAELPKRKGGRGRHGGHRRGDQDMGPPVDVPTPAAPTSMPTS